MLVKQSFEGMKGIWDMADILFGMSGNAADNKINQTKKNNDPFIV